MDGVGEKVLPNSIAHIPVPVAMSRTRLGFSMGAKLRAPSQEMVKSMCWRSRRSLSDFWVWMLEGHVTKGPPDPGPGAKSSFYILHRWAKHILKMVS